MKVVIPYRDDRNDGAELRYAIRSMVKHFTCMSGVVLVGDRPSWYIGEHIQMSDVPGRKEFSIYSKLKAVNGVVLYSNDDFFALKDFDDTLPYYFSGICGSYRGGDRTYRDMYKACPPEWLNFDIHVPMVINTELFEWSSADRPIKTQYANSNNLPGTQLDDLKLRGPFAYSDMQMLTQDKPFFSLNGNAMYPPIHKFLNDLYPIPSRYEYTGDKSI